MGPAGHTWLAGLTDLIDPVTHSPLERPLIHSFRAVDAVDFDVLLSSHSSTCGMTIALRPTELEARADGQLVVRSQPGLEYALMYRSAEQEWRLLDGDESVAGLIDRR